MCEIMKVKKINFLIYRRILPRGLLPPYLLGSDKRHFSTASKLFYFKEICERIS